MYVLQIDIILLFALLKSFFLSIHFKTQGEGINFSTLKKSPVYPLIDGSSAKSSTATNIEARYITIF